MPGDRAGEGCGELCRLEQASRCATGSARRCERRVELAPCCRFRATRGTLQELPGSATTMRSRRSELERYSRPSCGCAATLGRLLPAAQSRIAAAVG